MTNHIYSSFDIDPPHEMEHPSSHAPSQRNATQTLAESPGMDTRLARRAVHRRHADRSGVAELVFEKPGIPSAA